MTSSATSNLNQDLESFRQQWLLDLTAQQEHSPEPAPEPADEPDNPEPDDFESDDPEPDPAPDPAPERRERRPTRPLISSKVKKAILASVDASRARGPASNEPSSSGHGARENGQKSAKKRLISALDYFEAAVEKEARGNMGESLKLYRKAYRLDSCVDRAYREKHFPPILAMRTPKAALPDIATPPEKGNAPPEETALVPFSELIAGFANLKIQPLPAEIEGAPPPPCPIATLPDEILFHILEEVAIEDIADFVRLALVCRHFAHLVATDQAIWRRIALGSDIGFGTMHYHWQLGIDWEPLEDVSDTVVDGSLITMEELAQRRHLEKLSLTKSLTPDVYPTWKSLFRSRPRIRFNGCFISTINYIRTGQASTNQTTWDSPIHIVTYYRYLRFYRDGSVICLLTLREPADVVQHLTRANLFLHRGDQHPHLPSAVVTNAQRGRWRLSSALDRPDAPLKKQEGDLFIETEGMVKRYFYRMNLAVRSVGKGARSNKLIWRGFYSHNTRGDGRTAFSMKGEKPFFFSRVKSYGKGD